MKKFLAMIVVVALSLSFFAVGCDSADFNSQISSDTSTPIKQTSESENIQPIEDLSSKTHIVTGINVCEYEDYIFYRNTNDNGSLYRYNTKDDSYIKLFDKNYNAFLHHISVYDNYVYFVTWVESDLQPTLYRVPIDGGKEERLFDNVGDYYAITEEAIYYTDARNDCDIFALHKYTFADKKDEVLNNTENAYLMLKGNKLFFTNVRYLETGFDISLNYLNIENDLIDEMDIGDIHDIHYATSHNNCKNIFFAAYYDINKPCLASYNTETNKINVLSEEFDLFSRMSVVSDDLLYFQARKNGVWNIYQWYKGEISLYTDLDGKDTHSIETISGKPVLFSNSNSGGEKILGDDRLNVTQESK